MGLRAGSSKIRGLVATDVDQRPRTSITTHTRNTGLLSYSDPTSQKIIGIFGVSEKDINYVSLKISCSTGYTIDWGDGTVENYNSGVEALHKFNWSDISASTEVTILGAVLRQSKVTITAQGSGEITFFDFHERHDSVPVVGPVAWLELTINTPHVTSMQSSIGGGSILLNKLQRVNIISVHSSCNHADELLYGCYNLTVVEFGFDTSQISDWRAAFYNCRSIEILDHIDFSSAGAGSDSDAIVQTFGYCKSLKRVPPSFYDIDFSNLNNLSNTFFYCASLNSINLFDTSSITNFYRTFGYCNRLLYIPKFNTSSATSLYRTFQYCHSLRKIPKFNTSNVTNFRETFSGCYALKTIRKIDTSSGTNFYGMFRYCYNLAKIPKLDFSNATNIEVLFGECYNLLHVDLSLLNPNYNASMTSVFHYCRRVREITIPSTVRPTTLRQTFQNCENLIKVPDLQTWDINTRYGYYYTFYNNGELREIPKSIFYGLSNTGNTDWYRTFYNCYNLCSFPSTFFQLSSTLNITRCRELFRNCYVSSVPTLTLSAVTSDTNQLNMFYDTKNLSDPLVLGCKYNISFYQSKLSRSGIVNIFNNLTSVSKTIDIRSNPGVAELTSDDRAIATNKGWTITE